MTDLSALAPAGQAAPAAGAARLRCPACGGAGERAVVTLPGVPVMCGVLWDSPDEARAAALGDIELVVCPDCSMLRNAAFDERRIAYEGTYDNSLHFSPTFQRYADELARRLVEDHGVRGRTVVEVGSGKGDFLRLLCRLGGNRGWGYDPAYAGEQDGAPEDLTFVPEYFSGSVAVTPDLACARHVLEHLPEPAGLLRSLNAAAHRDALLYVEVPDAAYVLTPRGLWDLIYPHVGYFTAPALRYVVERGGFAPVEVSTAFGGQYLWALARATAGGGPGRRPAADEVSAVLARAEAFADGQRATVERWAARLDAAARAGQRVALWGAGSKGVTFLNVVPGGAGVADVVDVNPRKRGRFVPGTGQAVIGPDDLAGHAPDLVLIMNPNYEDEIRRALAGAGLDTTVAVV